MITIRDLKVEYGSYTVLNNLNIDIPGSAIHGLVGLNGSGKTTLLNTIYGLKKPSVGTVQYNSEGIKRNRIAYLETTNYFYPRITGNEYLRLFNIQNPDFDIVRWNNLFDLPLNKVIDDYSTGMKKKLALLGVLCLNRDILILDEPFNGLDMETVQKTKVLLMKMKMDKTIIITSHILESLISICDSISYLNNGKIQFTKDRKDFVTIEKEIFAVHQDKIDKQIHDLMGSL